MKTIVTAALSALLLSATANVFAADELANPAGHTAIGEVSASGTHLDELVAALSKKADAADAPYFHITSAGGKNRLQGTAILLK